MEIDHEIFSTVILLLLLIEVGLWQCNKQKHVYLGNTVAQFSGRVLDLRPRGRGFEPHRHQRCVVEQDTLILSLVLVQPRKTRPYITEDC